MRLESSPGNYHPRRKTPRRLVQETVDLSLPDPPSLAMPALDMLSDANLDFRDFFDSHTSGLGKASSFTIQ